MFPLAQMSPKSLPLTCGWRGELFILVVTKPILFQFFSPIFQAIQLFPLLLSFSASIWARELMPCVFLGKSTYTYSDMKLNQAKVKIWVWERPSTKKSLWLRSCCIFCRIGNILKIILSRAWDPIGTPLFCWIPCVSSCLALLTRVSIYSHILPNFCHDITGYIPTSFTENKRRFCTNALGFMVCVFRHTCCTRLCCCSRGTQHFYFRSSHGEVSFPSKQLLFEILGHRNCGSSYLAPGLLWVLMPWRESRLYPCSSCKSPPLRALEESTASQQSHPNQKEPASCHFIWTASFHLLVWRAQIPSKQKITEWHHHFCWGRKWVSTLSAESRKEVTNTQTHTQTLISFFMESCIFGIVFPDCLSEMRFKDYVPN